MRRDCEIIEPEGEICGEPAVETVRVIGVYFWTEPSPDDSPHASIDVCSAHLDMFERRLRLAIDFAERLH